MYAGFEAGDIGLETGDISLELRDVGLNIYDSPSESECNRIAEESRKQFPKIKFTIEPLTKENREEISQKYWTEYGVA